MWYLYLESVAVKYEVQTTTMSYILKKKGCTAELRNIKRIRRLEKTTMMHDRLILFLVKKNTFTPVGQIKYTLQLVNKRRLNQSKCKGFTTIYDIVCAVSGGTKMTESK